MHGLVRRSPVSAHAPEVRVSGLPETIKPQNTMDPRISASAAAPCGMSEICGSLNNLIK